MSDYGRQTGPDQLEFRRRFAADIETVWAFLTDPAKRETWFCGGVTEPRAGGRIVFDFDHRKLSERPPPDKYAHDAVTCFEGEVLVYAPPHKLAFSWPEADGEGSRVEITLTETGRGETELHLVHSGLGTREYRIGASAGWHAHFDLLADIAAGREPRDFWDRHMALEDEYGERDA